MPVSRQTMRRQGAQLDACEVDRQQEVARRWYKYLAEPAVARNLLNIGLAAADPAGAHQGVISRVDDRLVQGREELTELGLVLHRQPFLDERMQMGMLGPDVARGLELPRLPGLRDRQLLAGRRADLLDHAAEPLAQHVF